MDSIFNSMEFIVKVLVIFLLSASGFHLAQSVKLSQVDFQLIDRLIHLITILVWPLTVVFFIRSFEQEIRSFMSRMVRFSGPGGLEAEAEGQRKTEEAKTVENLISELEKYRNVEKTLNDMLEETKKTKSQYELFFHLERTYRLIFGSQLNIISIAVGYEQGVSRALAEAIYRRTTWANGIYPFEDYMNFLVSFGLLEYKPDKDVYEATALGKFFIEYLKANNISFNKPN